MSSTAVAADLITPLWLPRRATNPAGRLCHCAHPEINPLTYSVEESHSPAGERTAIAANLIGRRNLSIVATPDPSEVVGDGIVSNSATQPWQAVDCKA